MSEQPSQDEIELKAADRAQEVFWSECRKEFEAELRSIGWRPHSFDHYSDGEQEYKDDHIQTKWSGYWLARCGLRELESELSASQTREAALAANYHSLADLVHEAADTLGIPQGHVLERAIAVKARIKASQEQEPFKFCDTATGRVHDYAYDCEGNAKALYLEPVIPPLPKDSDSPETDLDESLRRQ